MNLTVDIGVKKTSPRVIYAMHVGFHSRVRAQRTARTNLP